MSSASFSGAEGEIYPGCSDIRSFPCMEATYPYAIKTQQKARNTSVGGFGCLELALYGIRELA